LTKAMLLMKLLTHSLTHPALAGMTNRIFWTWIGTVSSEM
jgi:hypothetical protein